MRGFTLIELLLALAVVGILALVSVPDLRRWQYENRSETLMLELGRLLAEARNTAVTTGAPVTLCSALRPPDCDSSWQGAVLVFRDQNGNRVLDRAAGEVVIRYWTPASDDGRLYLNSFPARPSLQFLPNGFTAGESGNLTWCPNNASPSAIRQLIYTRTGRARQALDRDGDGIREGTDGKALSCADR